MRLVLQHMLSRLHRRSSLVHGLPRRRLQILIAQRLRRLAMFLLGVRMRRHQRAVRLPAPKAWGIFEALRTKTEHVYQTVIARTSPFTFLFFVFSFVVIRKQRSCMDLPFVRVESGQIRIRILSLSCITRVEVKKQGCGPLVFHFTTVSSLRNSCSFNLSPTALNCHTFRFS